jgi:hypothetical protein
MRTGAAIVPDGTSGYKPFDAPYGVAKRPMFDESDERWMTKDEERRTAS